MKTLIQRLTTILALFIGFVVVAPWGFDRLKDVLPGMPDWSLPSLGDIFKQEKLPPESKLGEVRFVEFSPTALTPSAYVKGEIAGIESSRKTVKRFDFDPTSRARLREGATISVDMLVGYDAVNGKTPYYTRQDGDTVTLTINPDALVSIQQRATPFVNAGKIVCDDDRWKRGFLDEGDCDILVQGVPDLAVVGFRSCLGTTWTSIAQTIEATEQYRLEVLYKHFKSLRPDINWQKPTLKVVFEPIKPKLWGTLPPGWNRSTKNGREVLKREFSDGNKRGEHIIYVDQLKCTVDKGALKAKLHREAEKVPDVDV